MEIAAKRVFGRRPLYSMTYDHKKSEAKWRNAWAKDKKLYATDEKSRK